MQRRQVALEQAEHADDEQPRARVERRCGTRERSGSDLRSSCWRSPGRRTGCSSSRRRTGRRRTGSARRSRCEKSGHDRQHGGARKAERLEILAVELRVAEREIAAVDVGAQLAPAAEALPRQRPVDADEVLGRRDVVIDERHPIGQRERRPRRLRSDRKVVEQQVVGMAGVDQLAVVARQRLEPRDRPSRRRCPIRSRPRAARAGCRAPRGRWRRRSRASPAPDGRPDGAASLTPAVREARAARRGCDAARCATLGRDRPDRRGGRRWRRPRRRPAARAATARCGRPGRPGAPRPPPRRRGTSCRRRSSQPGSGSIGRPAGSFDEPRDHLEILPLDDRPVVVLAEELPAVPAQASRSATGSARCARSVSTNSARSS